MEVSSWDNPWDNQSMVDFSSPPSLIKAGENIINPVKYVHCIRVNNG
jgi:hypothetical protein